MKFFLVLNLAVAGVIGGWFVAQPDSRQREVRRLVENTFEHHKHVSALEVAWDIWQLYYADSATGKIAAGDKTLVYGGAPRPGPQANAPSFRVLTNQGYAVGYSDALGNPVWAAYHVRDLATVPASPPRPEKFEVDRRTTARITPEDYARSGYDRGHMAPNYAIATHYGSA
ncbi:MAG: DNA/RNA non-specific endonuclease, partial [Verrucomicrobia bacterium]|nr:DNA/RNA non-specific endonuclease [Verrucomicrobiota bacterium]